jgi:hypothetical protein
MMRQIHVGNIEIDNHIESDWRKSIPYCQTYIQLLWNIQRIITHWTFSKHKIITFNKKVIFAVINLTLQRNRGEWGDLAFGSDGSIDFLMG